MIESVVAASPWPFEEVIASWQAVAPAGTQIEIGLRAVVDGRWTRWWTMGCWSGERERRFSVPDQEDDTGRVETDTLVLRRPGSALQWRVTLRGEMGGPSPIVRGIALAISPSPQAIPVRQLQPAPALPVPERSQMVAGPRGRDLCAAAALTMVLQYWAEQTGNSALAPFAAVDAVETVTMDSIYDPVWDGTGNWAFNTAFAASLGFEAYVARFNTLAELGPWLRAGVPIIASIGWAQGELDGAAIASSAGHLLVIVGFTGDGKVIVNEPRVDIREGGRVRMCYESSQFERAWQTSSHGTVFLIYPLGWDQRRGFSPSTHLREFSADLP
jgi:hypothetical protein